MNHVKLIEFHKDSANCKSFVKDYNALAKTVFVFPLSPYSREPRRRSASGLRRCAMRTCVWLRAICGAQLLRRRASC